LELPGTLAGIADQERDRVRLRTRVVAGDEGVDRRQLVDEAVLEQEIERAVHGRRGRRLVGFLHPVQQLVGLHRAARVGDQPQHLGPDRGQAKATGAAGALDFLDVGVGTFDVVVRVGAGMAGHGGNCTARARRGRTVPGWATTDRRGADRARSRLEPLYASGHMATAAPMRASASSRPARYTVWPMSRLTWVPVIATRSGWATLPMPSSSDAAVSCRAALIASGVQSASAARRLRASSSGARAAALRCLATAFSS